MLVLRYDFQTYCKINGTVVNGLNPGVLVIVQVRVVLKRAVVGD